MLDVASLMDFDFFRNFNLISGRGGINRSISNVVILDYEGIEGDFSGFHEGEEDVIALTDKYQVPVFFFHDIYIEDVLLSITDQLRSRANFSYYENLIHTLVTTPSHSETIQELLHSFSSTRYQQTAPLSVSVLYFEYNETPDEFMLQRNVNKLTLKIQHMDTAQRPEIIKYKKGILIFSFFAKEENTGNRMAFWKNLICELALTNYRAGISDLPVDAGKLDIAIQRAIYAYRNALEKKCRLSLYSELNASHLLMVVCENNYVKEYLAELSILFQGSKNETFQSTICSLVRNHYDIDLTAAELFQHPNTIRYRINRIKETLHIEDEWEFQMLCALFVSQKTLPVLTPP